MTAGSPQSSSPDSLPGTWAGNRDYVRAVELGLAEHLTIPRVITVANPASGADWTVQVPPGVIWRFKSAKCVLTTSGAVASRIPIVQFSDGSNVYMQAEGSFAVQNSAVFGVCIAPGIATTASNGGMVEISLPSPFPPIVGSHTISIVTGGLQGADQYSAIALYVLQTRPCAPFERAAHYRALMDGNHSEPYPGLTIGEY